MIHARDFYTLGDWSLGESCWPSIHGLACFITILVRPYQYAKSQVRGLASGRLDILIFSQEFIIYQR